ncbi:hypothetical protein BDV98DRAFT_573897 [Pterulicium gracile]|uniref:Uncharacterized protein n=1 Tax=Pterulicium gracile TaxID=1884261 RepID=A0A5C3Q7W6_9AGAR|nr:hypothetical protein BDV98DRAFT_573897 [Pterula gracilis]
MYRLLRQPRKTRATWILLTATALSFLCCAMEYTGSVLRDLFIIDSQLNISPSAELLLAIFGVDLFRTLGRYHFFCSPVFMISDSLVIWRATCFFPTRAARAVLLGVLFFFACLFISRESYLIMVALYQFPHLQPTLSSVFQHNPTGDRLEGARPASGVKNTIASILFNLVGTLAIGFKAYQCNILYFQTDRAKTPPARTLLLMIESGLLYLIAQILTLIAHWVPNLRLISVSEVTFIFAASPHLPASDSPMLSSTY